MINIQTTTDLEALAKQYTAEGNEALGLLDAIRATGVTGEIALSTDEKGQAFAVIGFGKCWLFDA